MLNGKNILIIGGTGTFGRKFVDTILRDYPGVKRVIIYSRGEAAQYDMRKQYPIQQYPQLRFFIGDIRDRDRLIRACSGVDILLNAAGFSQADIAEYNPDECVKTYVYGTQNVIEAVFACKIPNIISLSSDKACAPINLYGASQLLSDKLLVAANNIRGDKDIKFSVVRFGNVIGTKGSVIPYFMERRQMGATYLPVTDKLMTRFSVTLQDCIDLVLFAIKKQLGGEIFIPKCSSYCIMDVAKAIAPDLEIKEIGARPGEKLHESLITSDDAPNTIEMDKCYAIVPSITFTGKKLDTYLTHYNASVVPIGFQYTSDSNPQKDSVETMRCKIRQYVNPDFKA